MNRKSLNIVAAEVRQGASALRGETPESPEEGAGEPRQLAIQVRNPQDVPLYVWASRRAFRYDPETHTLALYLTERTPDPPPGIRMISDHPRIPRQVVVGPGEEATVNVPLPAVMRTRVPGEGLGMHFVEEAIGPIDQVELHVQSATEPARAPGREEAGLYRKRLADQGEVATATIRTSTRSDDKNQKED